MFICFGWNLIFFRVFRYGSSDEEMLTHMAAAIRDDHMVVSSNLFAAYPELHLKMQLLYKTVNLTLLNFGS